MGGVLVLDYLHLHPPILTPSTGEPCQSGALSHQTSSFLSHHDIIGNLGDSLNAGRPRKWGYNFGMWEERQPLYNPPHLPPITTSTLTPTSKPPLPCPSPSQQDKEGLLLSHAPSASMTDVSMKSMKTQLSSEVTVTFKDRTLADVGGRGEDVYLCVCVCVRGGIGWARYITASSTDRPFHTTLL